MRLKGEGWKDKGCVASHPRSQRTWIVNTGIILSIISVFILGIIYNSSSIKNTASIIYYSTFTILML